jgi:aldehyde:ferredoxin oxidoreductase
MSSPENLREQILDLVRQYHQAKFAHKTFDPEKDLVHCGGITDGDENDLGERMNTFHLSPFTNMYKPSTLNSILDSTALFY